MGRLKHAKAEEVASEFRFDAKEHRYFYGELEIPGVTNLLRESRLSDYSGVPIDRLEYKRTLGLAVDYACDLLDQDNLDESTLHTDIIPYVNAYKKFKEVERFEPDVEKSQVPLGSRIWLFGGKCDVIGTFVDRFDNKPCLVDRKCLYTMYESTGAQLAAYEILIQENFKINVVKKFGLCLKKTGNYDPVDYGHPIYRQDFLAALHLHWRRRNHYKTQKGVERNDNTND